MLETRVYCPQEAVSQDLSAGGQLTVVNRGVATHNGRVCVAGGFWGEDCVLSTPKYKDLTSALALTYLETHELTRSSLVQLLCAFPAQRLLARRFAVRRALGLARRATVARCRGGVTPPVRRGDDE